MALLVPTTQAELFADPVGKVVAGSTYAYFCARPDLYGFALWGRSSAAEMAELVELLHVELGEGIAPHRSLVDARAVEGVDADAFGRLATYVRENFERLGQVVTRLAVLHPPGFVGATVSGFYQVAGAPYDVRLFADPAEALGWLEVKGGEQALVELEAVVASLRGAGPLVAELRARLAARPAEMTLASAAREMGVSERSLQRKLHDAGTTFVAEQAAARVRAAKARMLDTDASLTEIALDAGWATLARFSTAFRVATGETPSSFRKRRRAPGTS